MSRRVAVVGCGHVGAVTAAGLLRLGHTVAGVDLDASLVERLSAGEASFHEPGFPELLNDGLTTGRLTFTTEYEAARDCDFVFLCVSTPPTVTGAVDLRYIRGALQQLARVLEPSDRPVCLVNKSTSPLGTGESIDAMLCRAFPAPAPRPAVTANPEFLREGSAVHDFFHPDRIVVGAQRAEDAEAVAELYRGIEAPVVLTDLKSAEMIKYVSNAFLATRIAFINEIARLCEATHVDISRVTEGVGLDRRIGAHYLKPGIGYGGSCLPKDVAALYHSGDAAGVTMRVLGAVQEANLGQRTHVVRCLRRLLGTLDTRTLAVWGATFKGGTDDLRESPALDIIKLLRNEGARIRLYDPSIRYLETALCDDFCRSPLEAAQGAEAVLLLADWPEFLAVDFGPVAAAMTGRLLFDGRSALDPERVEAAGLLYYGIGRSGGESPLAAQPVLAEEAA